MVKVREYEARLPDGSVDIAAWLEGLCDARSTADQQLITTACNLVSEKNCFTLSLEIVTILHELGLDSSSLAAGMVYPGFIAQIITTEEITQTLGAEVLRLVVGVYEMDLVQQRNPLREQRADETQQKVQGLRKMLLAVVEDIRVVLIKLAVHICEMRAAVNATEALKLDLALQARDIYAPLANRLGVGQIKWELEDLSFRFLQPDVYKNIARLLDERRIDREKYVQQVQDQLLDALRQQNIDAKVYGRVKHIYSIWRKMQRKMVGYNEIYDVRAVRIVVDTITDCYAALGVVHNLWQHIPKEFDDYIAHPKDNGYKSLHTAVIGPEGKTLEIQIRTRQMHEQAELGVAAHWRYKEGRQHEPYYEQKLAQLRQILNWQEDMVLDSDAAEALRTEFFSDRVFVFTPHGDVVDLPLGATPIDFAYHIHSSVGDRCRGAKSNGKMIPLDQPLTNGAKIEIITAKEGGPSRDWLNPHLKYITTTKAKSKIQQWFKQQNRQQNIHDGRDILQRELKRLGFEQISFRELAQHLPSCNNEEDMLANLGNGDIKIAQIIGAMQRIRQPASINNMPHVLPRTAKVETGTSKTQLNKSEIVVAGVDHVVTHMARCCSPIPGDDIIGYITLGEGIAIHRNDCINVLQVSPEKKARLIAVRWGSKITNIYEVDIEIKAYNRRGLVRDISAVVSAEDVDIITIQSLTDKEANQADFRLKLELPDLNTLGRVLTRINQIPNIIDVYRVGR